MPTYTAFLSYTRFDDENSGWRITRLRELLEIEVRAVTGNLDFNIFQDVDDMGAGDHWPSMLDAMAREARFFIPILTPRYFNSPACRDELEKFIEAEKAVGRNDLILPILFRNCPILHEASLRAGDDLALVLHERQRVDWRGLRRADLGGDVPEPVEVLAARIEQIVRSH